MANTNSDLKTLSKQLRRMSIWDLRVLNRDAAVARDESLRLAALAELKHRGF